VREKGGRGLVPRRPGRVRRPPSLFFPLVSPSAACLAIYRGRASRLASLLRPPVAPAVVRALPRGGAAGPAPASHAGPPPPAAGPVAAIDPAAASSELLAGAAPRAPPPPRPPPASLEGLSAGTRTTVERHRELQDTLLDDLSGLAARLRANAEAAARGVADRGTLLDAAEATVDGATAAAQRSVAEAKSVYRTNKRGFWFTCLAFVGVGAAFTAAFVFIRATSMLGYSQRRAVAAAARRRAREVRGGVESGEPAAAVEGGPEGAAGGADGEL